MRRKTVAGRLTELRVVDFFASAGFDQSECRTRVAAYARSTNANVMTWSTSIDPVWPFRGVGGCIGPVVTVRTVNCLPFADFNQWRPSLGDMELF
jgi:hypothetical protein